MTNPTAHERVRSALESVVSGDSPPQAFEGFIAEMIAARALTPNDARIELEAAVRNGTLPPDSLRRLGLDNAPPATQPYGSAAMSAAKSDDSLRRRRDDQTHVRVFSAAPLAAKTPPGGLKGSSPMFARPSSVDSVAIEPESVSITPDPLPGGKTSDVGTLLGNRYRLEYKLGEGGMGVVYRATDLEVKGETFAVKLLKTAIRDRPESLKVMREEVRKTRALRHPNIVGVYSLNSDPTGVYILMEYLEGKSVSALIDEDFGRGMPMMRAWPLIHDIGSALAYAHDHNVIHSDVKPSNLFVTISGKAMLLDFGIARAVRARSGRFDTGTLGGLTPAYATAEMLSGNSPDQTDDVYSFACVIYEMLSGRHPFNGLGARDAQQAGLRPTPLATLTQRQNQTLAQALAFERTQRTRSVEDLLTGLEPSAPRWPPSLPELPPMWLGAAGVALCLVLGITSWLVLRKPASVQTRAVASPATPAVPSAGIEAPNPTPAPIATPTTGAGHTAPASAPQPTPGLTPGATHTAATPPLPAPSLVSSSLAAPPSAAPPNPLPSTSAAPAAARTARTEGDAAKPLEPVSTKAHRDATIPPALGSPSQNTRNPESAASAVSASVIAAAPSAEFAPPPAPALGAGPDAASTETAPAPTGATGGNTVPSGSAIAGTAAIAGVAVAGNDTSAGAAVTPYSSGSPAVGLPSVRPTATDNPPPGRKFSSIVPLPNSVTQLNSCPYPKEALSQAETGTVVLLVHVAPDGTVASTQVETSSGSTSLDQGAVSCVEQYGQFTPKIVGKPSAGYWGRMKFNWSFGG